MVEVKLLKFCVYFFVVIVKLELKKIYWWEVGVCNVGGVGVVEIVFKMRVSDFRKLFRMRLCKLVWCVDGWS